MTHTRKYTLSAMQLQSALLAATMALSGCYEATEKTVHLEQGWDTTNQFREISYNLSQGSNLIPYDWYLALEIPLVKIPLNSKVVTETLRYLSTDMATDHNPDKLPVGFVKNIDAQNREWMGLTCAACHTSQINYQGTGIRIDGGPAMGDFITLLRVVQLSIGATLATEEKFARFAYKLYGHDWLNHTDSLALEMKSIKQKLAGIIHRNNSTLASGYGRVDAFGSIGNEIFVDDLGIPSNFTQATAPADYPFLWNTPNLERVQWVGNVENPFGRNIGEVLGVFGEVNLSDPANLFNSSVQYKNIHQLEEMLRTLVAPKWPESILGAINQTQASRGEVIYKMVDAQGYACVSCHTLPNGNGQYPLTPAEDNLFGKQFIKTYNIPLAEIGTDTATADEIFQSPLVDVGPILTNILNDQNFLPRSFAQGAVVGLTLQKALAEMTPPLSDYEKAAYNGFRFYTPGKEPAADYPGYKARPLDGIWATAPYLHNGSVRNLTTLLRTPAARETTFWKGTREFDPATVGFRSIKSGAAQRFDATKPGNLNTGHEYGTSFSEQEKSDLIEFLKTL